MYGLHSIRGFPLHRYLLAAALAAATPAGAQRPRVVTGQPAALAGYVAERVGDSALRPVKDAEVMDLITHLVAITDAMGAFRLEGVESGWHLVTIRRLGYRPVTTGVALAPNETTDLDLLLARELRQLDTMRVLARRTEGGTAFVRRMNTGMGSYITRAEIERRQAHSAEDVLLGMAGLQLDRVTGEMYFPRNEYRSANNGGSTCSKPALLLDGAPVRFALGMRDIPASSIAAIEVYKSAATVPPELRTENAACGLIAVWTRVPGQ